MTKAYFSFKVANFLKMLDLVFRFTAISPQRVDCSLVHFQMDSFNAIKRLTIVCYYRTKTKITTLANNLFSNKGDI